MLKKVSPMLLLVLSVLLADEARAQTTCAAGKYKASNGVCTTCPAGSYCPGTNAAVLCPLGKSTNNLSGLSQCISCTLGSYASVTGSKVCTACPAGYYCPSTTQTATACPLGTSTNNQTNQTACTPCADGLVAVTTGSKSCTICPEGYICPNASKSIACKIGMASRVNAGDMRDTTKCFVCPIGTYANVAGTPVCKPCPDGFYCNDPTSAPIVCPKGTSSMIDNGNYVWNFPNFNIYAYYDSMYQRIWVNGNAFAIGERCYDCSLGNYADVTGLKYCKKCPEGYICPDKTAAPVACPTGYYSNNSTATMNYPISGDTCLRCSPGTFANKTSAATWCTPCPPNKVCPDAALSPIAAPSGFTYYTYQYWFGNEYLFDTEFSRCSKGWYVVNDNSTGVPTCVQCPSGFYCPDPSVLPQKCPPGLVSNWGASSCNACPDGNYIDINNSCQSCPQGSYCPDGVNAIPCPRGTYSYGGLNKCYSCGFGWSYTPGEGSTQCSSCPDGCCCNNPAEDPVCPYPWTTTMTTPLVSSTSAF